MPEIAFYNDSFVDINAKVVPIQERAHQFGDGIYEVIRVYNGRFFYMDEHLQRLQKSADAIELQLPYTLNEIENLCLEGLERSTLKEAEIYIQISRGIYTRQHHFPEPSCAVFTMTIKNARVIPENKRQNGMKVLTTEDDRWKNCYIKSLNLLPNVIAKQKAKVNGFDEAVFHDEGIVKEGCSTNVFVVKNGILHTYPALKGILHGITRSIVLKLASETGIEVVEEPFDMNFLYEADEVFITSTSMEVMPVCQVDDIEFSTVRPVTHKLIEKFQTLKD